MNCCKSNLWEINSISQLYKLYETKIINIFKNNQRSQKNYMIFSKCYSLSILHIAIFVIKIMFQSIMVVSAWFI